MAVVRALVVATALVVTVAGCSGGGSSDGDRTDTTTATGGESGAFIAEANAICTALGEQRLALTQPSAPSEVPAYAAEAQGYFADAIDALAELDPPADQQQTYDELLDALRTQLDTLDEIAGFSPDTQASELDAVVSRSAEAVTTSREAVLTLQLVDCIDVL